MFSFQSPEVTQIAEQPGSPDIPKMPTVPHQSADSDAFLTRNAEQPMFKSSVFALCQVGRTRIFIIAMVSS
jgi:hypothetical protein